MVRNSLGQIITNESSSLTVSILCRESTITLPTYNRFLLDNKEFTELVPTIDKDALIQTLSNEVTTLNNSINVLNNSVNALTADLKGGFLVSVTQTQFAYPIGLANAITYNGQQVYENIGFNNDTTSPNFNSRQSNGQKFWNIPNKEATIFQDATSRRIYNLNATIKFRFRYIGSNTINATTMLTTLQFFKFTNNNSSGIGNGVTLSRTLLGPDGLIKSSYSQNDVTETYEIILNDPGVELGGLTDIIYLPTRYSFRNSNGNVIIPNNFIMEILPSSTFSLLPQ
jgi:hypothetical protein